MKVLGLILVSMIVTTNLFAFDKCKDRYVPETTYDELVEIRNWATVLAFIPMAEKAGFSFDEERFMFENPNPNPGAFNFGFVTAYECYPIDVVSSYYSYATILTKLYYTNPTEFKSFYLKNSIKLGYMSYLMPLNAEPDHSLDSLLAVDLDVN